MQISNQPKPFKYPLEERTWDENDLYDAIDNNGLDNPENIKEIILEIPGENDGANWWWIVKTDDNRYRLISGGCDYTGWCCQSSIKDHGYFNSVKNAIEASPTNEEKDLCRNINIKETFKKQLNNELVVGSY